MPAFTASLILAAAPACGPGAALHRVDDWRAGPALAAAFDETADDRATLVAAIDRSLAWFDEPGSQAHYPFVSGGVHLTHAVARSGLVRLREIVETSGSGAVFEATLAGGFDLYSASGRNATGEVLFTGYFAPEYPGSRQRSQRFRYPLYGPPDDPARYSRREIESGNALAGREVGFLDDALNAYLVHVNGSVRLRLENGDHLCIGHCATNGRPYTSLGRRLIEEGLAGARDMSMQTIRRLFDERPGPVERLMLENDRYVFFEERPADAWPASSLGIVLTAGRSVATDRTLFPPGGLIVVETTVADPATGVRRRYVRLMLDQDSGGAIRGPGRADLYFGAGEEAAALAGPQRHPGRLHYLLPH